MTCFLNQGKKIVTRPLLRLSILLLIIVSVLYGATYQQFRHFDITDPRGSDDAVNYIKISHGNYNVFSFHRYRPLIPYMASFVQKALHPLVANEEELDKLSFYVVNFFITTGTALLLFGILIKLGFEWQLSILGTIFFLISRITVISVGTPLVDSLYFFAIGIIVYLMLYAKVTLLACICPLLVMSKETIIPFLFLPFAIRSMRKWKMVISILLSFCVLFVFRQIIQLKATDTQPADYYRDVSFLVRLYFLQSLRSLCSPAGIHSFFNGFAFLIVLFPLGILVNRRYHKYKIPGFLLLLVPIAFGLALLNSALGRMFFAAYVPVIAYSLVLIEHCFEVKRSNHE